MVEEVVVDVVVGVVAVEGTTSYIRTENRSAAGASTTNGASRAALTSIATDKESVSFGADDEQIMMPQPLTTTGKVAATT